MPFEAQELLGRGFLPAELPPIFTSRALGAAAGALLQTPIGQLKRPVERCLDHAWDKKYRLIPTTFNLARQGSLRRRLQLPHPLAYANLCQHIEANGERLNQALARSSWSCSRPHVNKRSDGGRALERSLKDEAIVEANAKVRATSRYVLITDISQFYHQHLHSYVELVIGREGAGKGVCQGEGV